MRERGLCQDTHSWKLSLQTRTSITSLQSSLQSRWLLTEMGEQDEMRLLLQSPAAVAPLQPELLEGNIPHLCLQSHCWYICAKLASRFIFLPAKRPHVCQFSLSLNSVNGIGEYEINFKTVTSKEKINSSKTKNYPFNCCKCMQALQFLHWI